MIRYAVVIEQEPASYGVYVPDLPGCVAVGTLVAEVKRLIVEAIDFHLEGLNLSGTPIPDRQFSAALIVSMGGRKFFQTFS